MYASWLVSERGKAEAIRDAACNYYTQQEAAHTADRVDAGDPAVRNHQDDRHVELAGEIDLARGRTVQPRKQSKGA